MKVVDFVLSEFQVNNYLLIHNKEAILIDIGFEPTEIIQYIEKKNLVLKAILLTHTHLDHIGGLEEIREQTKSPVYVHKNEQEWLQNPQLNGSDAFPYHGPLTCQPAEKIITNEKQISVGDFEIKILKTPGHTPGGISYLINSWVFTGDTLFYRSIGRTDLYGGDQEMLVQSIINKLFILPDETIVFPGHGPKTTIGEEKKSNPFVGL